MAIKLILSKETDEEHAVHSKSYNVKFVSYDKVNIVIQERLNHFFLDIN